MKQFFLNFKYGYFNFDHLYNIKKVADCYSSTSNIDIITTFSPAISTTNLIRHNIISMFMCLDPVIIIEGKAFILVFFAHIILLK